MAQETYGNWLGPKRLVRQPGIYSVAGTISPLGNSRPASPDSFEEDYDDVSMAGSERSPPAKGVYLLAGPPSPALNPPDDSDPKLRDLDPKFGDLDPKFGDLEPKSGDSAPKSGDFGPKCAGGAALWALLVLSSLAWAALAAAAAAKHLELRAELEQLRENLSALWDSVQQDQTRLQFGIHQHQQELQELSAEVCRSLGGSRRCPPGWQSQGGGCFSFSREALGWGSARDACAHLGAHLAVVGSQDEQLFLLNNSERNFSYWLGVTVRKGRWAWVNGEEPKLGFWDFWGPEAESERGDCGALAPHGRWVRESCGSLHRWICEKPAHC